MRRSVRSAALLALVVASSAWAQRVVILEIDGDPSHKLRSQIETAVRASGTVETVPLSSYVAAAAKRKLKGAAAFTPAGVARTSKLVRFDAAVSGEVDGSTYRVIIWDRAGEQLWTKDLPLKRGQLSEDFATKLARAITAAAEQGAAKPDQSGAGGADDETTLDVSGREPTVVPPKHKPAEDPNHDADLDAAANEKKEEIAAPPIFTGWLAGSTTWRSQCLRPGVSSCREYDQTSTKPQGIVIDFTAPTPYLGFAAGVDFFPLRHLHSEGWHRFVNGLGLTGNFNLGFSVIRLVEETTQGQGTPVTINSTDVGWSILFDWRVHFAMGFGKPQPVGFVGIHAGFQARSFNIDPTAMTSLPSSVRVAPTGFGFPSLGLDVAIPLVPYFRLEGSISFFPNPKPSAEQIIGYGSLSQPDGGATSTGWGLDVGATGHIVGPLGYLVKLRYQSFADKFDGQGQKWTVCNTSQCGGAGEESYLQIIFGASAQF